MKGWRRGHTRMHPPCQDFEETRAALATALKEVERLQHLVGELETVISKGR